jgi:hypothetical protein
MRAHEIISELFGATVPFKVIDPKIVPMPGINAAYKFRAGETDYIIYFKDAGEEEYVCSFGEVLWYNDEGRAKLTYDPADQGNAFMVYSGVKSAFLSFIRDFEPERVSFKGYNDKQADLYMAVLNKSKNLPTGYEFSGRVGDMLLIQRTTTVSEAANPVISESPVRLWHGSFSPNIKEFQPFGHFGTAQAALDRIKYKARLFDRKYDTAYFYEVSIDTRNLLMIKDVESMTVFEILAQIVKNTSVPLAVRKKLKPYMDASWNDKAKIETITMEILSAAGYSAICYINKWEHRGSVSYMNLVKLPVANRVKVPIGDLKNTLDL